MWTLGIPMAIWPTKDNARGSATVCEGLAWQLRADKGRLAVMQPRCSHHCFLRTVAGLWAWSGVGTVAVRIPQVHRGRSMKSKRPSVDGRDETEDGRGRG